TRTLREGAHEMLRVEGEIGATLFAAASGLREPGELRLALNAEADAIFAPKAKTRRLNQVLERFEASRRAMRDSELRVSDWKELNARIEALRGQLEDTERRRAEVVAEQAKLQRLKRLAPLVRLLDETSERLDQLGPVPVLPLGFAKRLHGALEAEASAAQRHLECMRSFEELTGERDSLPIDEALVARTGEVAALFAETGRYAKAREDLPAVDREAEAMRADLETLAKRLGLAKAKEITHRRPSDAELAALRVLCREGRVIETELSRLSDDLARERQSQRVLQLEEAARGDGPIDPEPLRERLAAAAPVLRRLEQRVEMEPAIEAEAKALAEAARRLSPPVESLDALARASLPPLESIARFRRENDALSKASDRAREEARTAGRECGEIEGALERLEGARAVASLDAIVIARSERDTLWQRLRAALFGAELSAPARATSAASFEQRIAHADRLADEALGDAQRVAQHSLLARQLQTARERKAIAQEALAAAELREREANEAWRAAWSASCVSPSPPAEMEGWSRGVSALLDRRTELLARREKLQALVVEDRTLAPVLRSVAEAAGLAGLRDASSFELAHRLDARLRKLQERWEVTRRQKAKLDTVRERIEEIDVATKDASLRLEAWAQRWRSLLPKFGISVDASLDEGEAALAAWDEVPDALARLAREERRIIGMRRDNAEFERRVSDVLAGLAPDLEGLPFEVATKTLHARTQAAATMAARREDCSRRLVVAIHKEKNAKAALAQARAALASLASEAGLARNEDLRALSARLEGRAVLETELGAKRDELLRAADGFSEQAIRDELSCFDAETAEAKSSELEGEQARLERESKDVLVALDREEQHRRTLEAGVGAELAAQMRRNAEVELVAASREWAVLKLGALVLGTAIERHRQATQNPLLARAGELFRALTGGAFIGLGSVYDEDDCPILVAKRARGESVKIEGLSEGTRDQLYLALRLAYVEAYAAKLDPPPFIADDIFVTFDDQRTEHGIVALAEIGRVTQCLLFTHHRRTAEIAAERLGAEVDIIELSSPG
ncbi:MAG: AAA family ATPase, partial [Hyphomicrobiales bacterium]|nr:AAA family ATPase [Hyphomicrobiales bacterium]